MSTRSDRKRRANEPIEVLLTQNEGAELRVPTRPASIMLGALFVFGRGLAGLLWLGAFLLAWPEVVVEADIEPDIRTLVLWVFLSVGLLFSLISMLIAWSIWRGSNLARVLVMIGVTISTTSAAVGYFVNGDTITIKTTLLTVALDILVLLALSSHDARAWARRPRTKRAHR